ncbi:MAG: pyridoxamine 5'-phosphate oxidase family protein [Steroidobacteraceae bacterium]
MDSKLRKAIEAIHAPADWVHFATIGRDGAPHVTPLMMGLSTDHLLFSLTGKQKVRNLERDPRACVSMARPGSMAHVIVWGTVAVRHDAEAQVLWDEMIRNAFGDAGLEQRQRGLSAEGTQLGLLTPRHWRIYGIEERN